MLTTLKAKMRNDVEFRTSLEESLEHINESNDDLKDVFLDDFDAMIIGAENDPEIEKLVDTLPDDVNEETNDVTEKDIDELIEGFIPMSRLTEEVTASAEDSDPGDGDADEHHKEDTSKTDVGEDQDDIEDAPDEAPTKENFDFDLFDDVIESDNMLGEDQDDIEDAPDKGEHEDNSKFDNIDGEDQDDIEDAPDKGEHEDNSKFDNIDGEDQDDIEDASDNAPTKESSDDLDLDDDMFEDIDEFDASVDIDSDIEDASDNAPTKESSDESDSDDDDDDEDDLGVDDYIEID